MTIQLITMLIYTLCSPEKSLDCFDYYNNCLIKSDVEFIPKQRIEYCINNYRRENAN